ncbi:MAG: histone deacetylase [Euryarchaeota archaeon]|uniref:Deacetylase n=1 Tax=uncultured euryarchaeote Alv-FOS4 TaxID=337893 RepID=Q3SA60_9EURY|nr:deacetylase [uncultured euryarchaeote Alv-FOS4]NPA75960.1 histone deacetylase [Euryarchaeota archaeon]
MRCAVTYNPTHVYHNMHGSPEKPERIENVYKYLKMKLSDQVDFFDIREPANMEDILAVHTEPYLEFLERMSMRGPTFLGDSTYLNKYSYLAALMAAEASIIASDYVVNMDYDFAYALVRPPGHHATEDMYGGYCLLNNAAITARHVQERGLRRVAIIDWDAHAANGTMKIFYSTRDVLLISLHRDPRDFYPHEGFIHQIGRGEGTGYTVNIPLPAGAGDVEYLRIFEEIIRPIIRSFSPQFIIGDIGFDAHYSDKNIGLALTSRGYVEIIRSIKSYGRMFMLVQEGGYTPHNREIAYAIMEYLLRGTIPEENVEVSDRLMNYKKVYKDVDDIISKLKFIFSSYFDMG